MSKAKGMLQAYVQFKVLYKLQAQSNSPVGFGTESSHLTESGWLSEEPRFESHPAFYSRVYRGLFRRAVKLTTRLRLV